MWFPLLCKNVGAIHSGLIAGWLANWLADRLAGRQNNGKFWILKFFTDQIFKLFAVFNKVTALLEQYECIEISVVSRSLFCGGC